MQFVLLCLWDLYIAVNFQQKSTNSFYNYYFV